MQIIRTFLMLSILCTTVGGCTIIRGSAAGPAGDAWYVRAGFYTGKVKGIHYCPAEETVCYEAPVVSNQEFASATVAPTTKSEQ